MDLALWRDISIVILALHLFVLLIFPLVIAFFLVKGINWVHRQTAPLLNKAQTLSRRMRDQSAELSQQAVAPLIKSHAKSAQAVAFWRQLWPVGVPSSGALARRKK